MPSGSREWRIAELEALKEYDPGIIIALYARIPYEPHGEHPRRHLSFSCMIEAIVDAEESLSQGLRTSSFAVI